MFGPPPEIVLPSPGGSLFAGISAAATTPEDRARVLGDLESICRQLAELEAKHRAG